MDFNGNGKRQIDYASNIYYQDSQTWSQTFSNQDHNVQDLQHDEQQEQHTKKKKSRGNRKLQRYRRKFRKQGMDPTAIAHITEARVDIDSGKSDTGMNQNIQSRLPIVNKTISGRTTAARNHKNIKQRNKNMKTKEKCNRSIRMSELNLTTSAQPSKKTSKITDTSVDYTNVPDQTFYRMLATAFNGTDKFHYFMSEEEKIEFVRHYTSLMDRLSYVKLQQQQWDYYHHIGITQHIWTSRISKELAEKNSICYTYGKSKGLIQQRRKKIQEQLQQAQDAVRVLEHQILSRATFHNDCRSEIKALSSIVHTFIYENQQKLRDEFEYKRQKLIFDASDHRLLQAFFDLKPNKSQITAARRIWQATVKQTKLDEEIAILEHRLTSSKLPPASTLFDHMIDNIDTILAKPNNIVEQNTLINSSSHQLEKMNQLKHDVIHQIIITARQMTESFVKSVLEEKQKYSLNEDLDEYSTTMKITVINAIETRRLYMIERAKYITQYKLATYFMDH